MTAQCALHMGALKIFGRSTIERLRLRCVGFSIVAPRVCQFRLIRLKHYDLHSNASSGAALVVYAAVYKCTDLLLTHLCVSDVSGTYLQTSSEV